MMKNFFKVNKIENVEQFEKIIETENLKVERIISSGQSTPEGEWYDQGMNELVFLLKGSAAIKIWEEDELIELREGDYLNIPAHLKHRVEYTDKKKPTLWLAIHYKD